MRKTLLKQSGQYAVPRNFSYRAYTMLHSMYSVAMLQCYMYVTVSLKIIIDNHFAASLSLNITISRRQHMY